jgi:hypothetical protein
MSLPSGLKFSSAGAVGVQAVAPTEFVGGVGVINGVLTTDPGAPVVFPNGNPCVAAGNVCNVAPGAGPFSFQNGFKYDSTGRLVTADVGVAAAPLSSQNGLTFDADGALVTVAGDTISDPFWGNVVALISGNGSDGATFVDQSSFARTLTLQNGVVLTTGNQKFGPGSVDFAPNKRYKIGASAPTNLGTNDFTVEFWSKENAGALMGLVGTNDNGGTNGFLLQRGFDSTRLVLRINSIDRITSGAGTFPNNVWNFIQLLKSGTTYSLYLNGSLVGTYAGSNTSNDIGFWVGVEVAGNDISFGNHMTGQMEQLRITRGVLRPTTVPTAPWPIG